MRSARSAALSSGLWAGGNNPTRARWLACEVDVLNEAAGAVHVRCGRLSGQQLEQQQQQQQQQQREPHGKGAACSGQPAAGRAAARARARARRRPAQHSYKYRRPEGLLFMYRYSYTALYINTAEFCIHSHGSYRYANEC